LELDGAGKTLDVLTLHELLAGDRELADAGGIAFLAGLSDGLYRKAPLGDYCRIVKETAILRRVLAICENATAKVSEGRRPAEVIDSVAADFDSVRDDNRSLERGPVHVSTVTKELVPVLERAANGQGQMIGVPTGYSDIDR
jgi:replicative DNA helicase